MSAVGSLIFCDDCGNLLDNPEDKINNSNVIECSQCQAEYAKSQFTNLKVVTSTSEDAFPSSLRLKRSVVKTHLKRDELTDSVWYYHIHFFMPYYDRVTIYRQK